MKTETRTKLKPYVWALSMIALLWAGLVFAVMVASFAGEVAPCFWSALVAIVIYVVSTAWLKRA